MGGRRLGVVVLVGAAGVAACWMLQGRMPPGAFPGVVLGILLATAGALGGLVLTAWSVDKGQTQFLGAMVFGILARFLVYGAVLVYVALRTAIDVVATAFALLAFYVLFLILEIRFAIRGVRGGGA
jgi:hypothetical protein